MKNNMHFDETEGLIGKVEIPKDGFFVEWVMDKVFPKEIAEMMQYPLKKGRPFTRHENHL